MLSRIHVEIKKRPQHSDGHLSLKTWPKGITRLFALRDFEGYINGEQILKATSSWAILSGETDRPSSVEELSSLFTERENEHAIKDPASKVIIPEEFKQRVSIQPVYMDLDEVGHVNNARYLDWAWNVVPAEYRKRLSGWTVNYIREIREGQVLSLQSKISEQACTVVGFLQDKPAFAISFTFQ